MTKTMLFLYFYRNSKMPSGRRGSLERYMPPRRSGGGSGTDQDSPTKSSQGGGEYGAGITDWSAALDLEDELDTLHIGMFSFRIYSLRAILQLSKFAY